ncbi:serine hydrolase-like protein 2-like [Scleropages formosus]|uniref:Serine hydrolase-like protein 2-like n=1 Tax=Scleropages formosus TaxID=113540 RepID=A0A0N8K1W6_SCLFO|nr:serine hydrolase-like protein 2-like [Scleropages formosus]
MFYTFPAYLSDVRRVIEALQWKRFSIIGHSMEMVESVVLLDSVGFQPTDMKRIPELIRKGVEEMIEYEKKKDEKTNRVYTYEKAVERLMVANPSLSEQSAHILLERGSTRVEGGVVFNRDFRINLATVVTVPGDHYVHLNSPETVASIVTDFLKVEPALQADSSTVDVQPAKL